MVEIEWLGRPYANAGEISVPRIQQEIAFRRHKRARQREHGGSFFPRPDIANVLRGGSRWVRPPRGWRGLESFDERRPDLDAKGHAVHRELRVDMNEGFQRREGQRAARVNDHRAGGIPTTAKKSRAFAREGVVRAFPPHEPPCDDHHE